MTQRVFITGGASGLGRAIALRYAKEGARVCIGDINPEQGVAVEAELNNAGGEGYFVECDVRRLSDFEKVRDDLFRSGAVWTLWSTTPALPLQAPLKTLPLVTGNGSSTSTYSALCVAAKPSRRCSRNRALERL